MPEEPVPITKEGLVESADKLAALVGSDKEGKKVAQAAPRAARKSGAAKGKRLKRAS